VQIIHVHKDENISPLLNYISYFDKDDTAKHPSSYSTADRSTIQNIKTKCAGGKF
jgi:hypothetical protein